VCEYPILKRETKIKLGVELHTLDYWHTAVGIGRVKVGKTFSRSYQDELGETEEAKVDDDNEDVLELQSSRTIAMSVGNYSVLIDIVKHLSIRSIDAFRPLSTAWHRFLGVDGKGKARQGNVGSSSARKRPLRESISSMVLLPKDKDRRVEDLQEEEIRQALRQVLKKQNVS
jgi:hypothetical protein